jgi:hypothetical protein
MTVRGLFPEGRALSSILEYRPERHLVPICSAKIQVSAFMAKSDRFSEDGPHPLFWQSRLQKV